MLKLFDKLAEGVGIIKSDGRNLSGQRRNEVDLEKYRIFYWIEVVIGVHSLVVIHQFAA